MTNVWIVFIQWWFSYSLLLASDELPALSVFNFSTDYRHFQVVERRCCLYRSLKVILLTNVRIGSVLCYATIRCQQELLSRSVIVFFVNNRNLCTFVLLSHSLVFPREFLFGLVPPKCWLNSRPVASNTRLGLSLPTFMAKEFFTGFCGMDEVCYFRSSKALFLEN